MQQGSYQTLAVETCGAIDIVILNRPDRLNAITTEMIDELLRYFRSAAESRIARVIVLRGAGRAFCAGMDLGRARADENEGLVQAMFRVQESLSQIILAMRRCHQPIIALVHGAAAGGGFALPLAADIRIGTADTRFIPSFVKIGLSACDVGLSYFLPRLVGRAQAAQIMMAGQTVDAERALRIGLLNDIVAEDALLEVGLALAGEMLRASPMGLKMTKDVFNLNVDAPSLETAIAIENRTQVLLGQTEDLREGVAAFLAKRPPAYENR